MSYSFLHNIEQNKLIVSLTGKVTALEEKINSMKLWESIPLASIGSFGFKSKDVVKYAIPTSIPATATEVLIVYFLRCGNEPPSRDFKVNMWTNVNGKKYQRVKFGHRYPQSAISFDSENLWFPISVQDRNLYVQSDDVQLNNCHNVQFFVIGYRN